MPERKWSLNINRIYWGGGGGKGTMCGDNLQRAVIFKRKESGRNLEDIGRPEILMR